MLFWRRMTAAIHEVKFEVIFLQCNYLCIKLAPILYTDMAKDKAMNAHVNSYSYLSIL